MPACYPTQSCPTLCNPMDWSPPDSSLHEIPQARILEWVPFPTPGSLPDPEIELVSPASSACGFLITEPPRKPTVLHTWHGLFNSYINFKRQTITFCVLKTRRLSEWLSNVLRTCASQVMGLGFWTDLCPDPVLKSFLKSWVLFRNTEQTRGNQCVRVVGGQYRGRGSRRYKILIVK